MSAAGTVVSLHVMAAGSGGAAARSILFRIRSILPCRSTAVVADTVAVRVCKAVAVVLTIGAGIVG